VGWNLFTKKTVNIVIKDHVIRYLEARQPHINAVCTFGERYLPPGVIEDGRIIDKDKLHGILQECVKEWRIKGCEVQFLAPDPVIVVRKLKIPLDIKEEEIMGYLYLELGTTIHLPFDNPIFTTEVLREREGNKEILLFSAPESVVLEYVSLFENVGLKPIVADISPLAIYRLYYMLIQDKSSEATLTVQFDLQTIMASIFKDHKLIFVRHLKMNTPFENWNQVEVVSEGLQRKKKRETNHRKQILSWVGEEDYLLGELQEMTEEIERILNFYLYSMNKGNEAINRIVLTGDHPYLTHIKELLKGTIEGDVITLDQEFLHSSVSVEEPFYLPLGLGLKGGI
jgi:type IV pilus assembly protein PilM